MKIQLLHSPKERELIKQFYTLPDLQSNQFIIKTKYCGLCRNDISAFVGETFRMPLGREGHEGAGYIIKVHEDYKGKFKIGDNVSTFDSDPAFGEFYYSDDSRAVLIPECSPEYILEPVACAINIIIKTLVTLSVRMAHDNAPGLKILLVGSGFMSILIKEYCKYIGVEIEVAGSSNKKHWDRLGVNLKPFRFYIDKKERFDAVIDLSGHAEYYPQIVNELTEKGAIICMGSTPKKDLILDFNTSAWKDLTYIFPSPRTNRFNEIMNLCAGLIQNKILNTEFLWSKDYNFEDIDECIQGFNDGLNRSTDYIKGYVRF